MHEYIVPLANFCPTVPYKDTSETFQQTQDFKKMSQRHAHSPRRHKQAIVVGLLLMTPGDDDGRRQVLSTVDGRPPDDHTQRPTLCIALWA